MPTAPNIQISRTRDLTSGSNLTWTSCLLLPSWSVSLNLEPDRPTDRRRETNNCDQQRSISRCRGQKMSSQTTPYQSTPRDRTRGLALGIWYVVLAVALGYMLFKIWPPVPWPDPINHQEVISRALSNCGYPIPPPAPTPSGSPPTTEKSAPVEMPINFFSRKCVMT